MRALVCVVTAMLVAAYGAGAGLSVTGGHDGDGKGGHAGIAGGPGHSPGHGTPLDLHKAAERNQAIWNRGTAGQSAMITNVVVKPHDIEVLLGGGGYGTFSDAATHAAETPTVTFQAESPAREGPDGTAEVHERLLGARTHPPRAVRDRTSAQSQRPEIAAGQRATGGAAEASGRG